MNSNFYFIVSSLTYYILMLDGNNTKLGYSLVVFLVTSMEEDSFLGWKMIYSQRSDCYFKKKVMSQKFLILKLLARNKKAYVVDTDLKIRGWNFSTRLLSQIRRAKLVLRISPSWSKLFFSNGESVEREKNRMMYSIYH